MKLGMSHYGSKSIPDAKFQSGSSSNLEIRHHKSSNPAIYPRKMSLTFKKIVFMSRIVLLDPKLTPMSIFSNFQAKENFLFCKFLGRLDERRAAATPLVDQFC